MHSEAMDVSIRKTFSAEQKQLYALDKTITQEDWIKFRDFTAQKFDIDHPQQFSNAICGLINNNTAQIQYLTQPLAEHLSNLEIKNMLAPKDLCEDRNADWVIKLSKILSNQKHVFIAVGCAHLVGETGLLLWLQANGYTLENLTSGEKFEPFHYVSGSTQDCTIS